VGTAAGAAAGAAAGCAIGGIFGPIGCAIGAIIGAILGGALGGGAAAAIGAIAAFNSDPGNVQDANVGDQALGPIRANDWVVVYGHHVYDGFHEGWHELHPLMAVMKINQKDPSQYLEWNPNFPDGGPIPPDRDDMPAEIRNLQVDDMRKGLASQKFERRARWLKEKWCRLVRERFDGATQHRQAQPDMRWTIHPLVDGCQAEEPPPIR
jgi:hypothetical protein